MTAPLHTKTRTLEELRFELSTRLGFVSLGQTAVMHKPLLTSFLQEAAEQVYAQYGDDLLFLCQNDFLTHEGVRWYPFPEDCDPFKITKMVLEIDGSFRDLHRGIPDHFRAASNTDPARRKMPTHWDIGAGDDPSNPGKIELWPIPDLQPREREEEGGAGTLEPRAYKIHLSYYPIYAEHGWTKDDQACPVYPSRLVLLLALGNAKSHYGMPDAQSYFQQFDALLQKHKASLLQGYRFKVHTEFDAFRGSSGTGMRKRIGDDIVIDLTPPESITTEYGDTILPESSTEAPTT